ncbi:hypothetical protein ABZ917_41665 [Nonomuraea wenchangensis]
MFTNGFHLWLAIVLSEGFQSLRQCAAGFNVTAIDDYPVSGAQAHTLTINAPPGARWAVLVAKLP